MPPSTLETPNVTLPVIQEFIGIRPGYCGGKPHVIGHRIKVQHIAIWHERQGMSPEEIVATYPTLPLAAVHAALAYYHSHQSEIDADIVADEKYVADMKAKSGPSLLRQKLAERGHEHGSDDSLSS